MFYTFICKPSYCNFQESRKKNENCFFFILSADSIICFVKKYIFEVLLCIFESDTFKRDCPVQIFRKMMKFLKI